jgi:hypothetical protein
LYCELYAHLTEVSTSEGGHTLVSTVQAMAVERDAAHTRRPQSYWDTLSLSRNFGVRLNQFGTPGGQVPQEDAELFRVVAIDLAIARLHGRLHQVRGSVNEVLFIARQYRTVINTMLSGASVISVPTVMSDGLDELLLRIPANTIKGGPDVTMVGGPLASTFQVPATQSHVANSRRRQRDQLPHAGDPKDPYKQVRNEHQVDPEDDLKFLVSVRSERINAGCCVRCGMFTSNSARHNAFLCRQAIARIFPRADGKSAKR